MEGNKVNCREIENRQSAAMPFLGSVQRLSNYGVDPSGSKRLAPETGEEIVSSVWEHTAVSDGLGLATPGEENVTIQKKMLPIAKRLLTFGKFAQKETKPQKQGLEIRHRRYERFPIVDSPLAEGVTPDFVSLEHTTLMHTL